MTSRLPRRPRAVAALAIACAACGGGDDGGPLRLDLPIDAADRAALVHVSDATSAALTAVEIVDGRVEPLRRPLAPTDDLTVTALLYAAPLAELEIAPGPLAPAEDGAPARALPAPRGIERARVEGAAASPWTPLDALPAPLDAYRIPAPDPCPRFEVGFVPLGRAAPTTFTLALDDTWALVGTEADEVYFVDGAQAIRQSVPTPLFAGYRRADGELWLGGEAGAIFRATFTADPTPQVELTAAGSVTSGERVIDLVGAPDGPIEHFAQTRDLDPEDEFSTFEWFDGAAWSVPALRRRTPHNATWVSRGYGLFTSFFRDGEVYGARDGQEVSILVDTIVFGNIVHIHQVPGVGLAAGSTSGEVHLDDGGPDGWRLLGAPSTQPVADTHGYEGGLLILQDTQVTAYVEGRFCEAAALLDAERTAGRHVDVVGRDVVFGLVPREGVETDAQRVAWFTRQ